MTFREAKAVLEELKERCRAVCDIAKRAGKHRKSLTGSNYYGEKFHAAVVSLSVAETKIGQILAVAATSGDDAGGLSSHLDTLKSPKADRRARNEALKQVKMTCDATLLPAIESQTADPVPKTEQVLPLDIVRPTRRKYIERVVNEAIYESWEVKRAGAEKVGRELPHIPLAVGVGRSGPSQTTPAVPVHALPTHIP